MVMVALGLNGVLWQNVTRRTKEIGLRRACGASAGAVFRQIAAEILLLTTVSAALGMIFNIHIFILNIIANVNGQTYIGGALIALIIIYLLTTVCTLYPGYWATRVHPAEALHYE
jgi:putative ABC transport system permease protein